MGGEKNSSKKTYFVLKRQKNMMQLFSKLINYDRQNYLGSRSELLDFSQADLNKLTFIQIKLAFAKTSFIYFLQKLF